MKTRITILFFFLTTILLVSCAPGTVTPTATPSAIIIPTITPTPAPATLADLPELSNWIEEYVHAYGGKVTVNGVKMDSRQLTAAIRQNPEGFIQKKPVNGVEYLFVVVNEIPLFIAVKNDNNEWIWSSSSLKEMCGLNGLKCGSTISGDEDYQNPLYDQKIVNDFSIINCGGTSPQSVSRYGLQFEYRYSLFAKQNGISFKPGHLFYWGDENPVELNTASTEQITEWMNQWVHDVVNGYPYFDSINFANESVGIYDGSQYWVTESNPWYKAYQEQWPVEAYSMIFNQLEVKGLQPGSDVHLILNLPYLAKEWGYNPQFTLDFMALIKKEIQAKVGPEAIMDIGIQFHLRDVPQSQVDWGGPNIEDLDEAKLTQFFTDLGQIGPVHITEMSVKNVQNPENAIKGVNLVLSSAIKSGTVKDVVFWEAFKENNFLFNAQFQNNRDYYLVLQMLLANLEK